MISLNYDVHYVIKGLPLFYHLNNYVLKRDSRIKEKRVLNLHKVGEGNQYTSFSK